MIYLFSSNFHANLKNNIVSDNQDLLIILDLPYRDLDLLGVGVAVGLHVRVAHLPAGGHLQHLCLNSISVSVCGQRLVSSVGWSRDPSTSTSIV